MGEIIFRIRHASDDRNSILETKLTSSAFTRDRNIDIWAQRQRQNISKEPTIESIHNTLKGTLNITGLVRSDERKSIMMRVGNCKYLIN